MHLFFFFYLFIENDHGLVKIGFNAQCFLVCNNCTAVLTADPLCLGCMEAKTLFIFLLFNENLVFFYD